MAIKQSKSRDVPADFELMTDRAKQASEFLKALSHESRLLILCHLSEGEKSVSDLEELLDSAAIDGIAAARAPSSRRSRRDEARGKVNLLQFGQRRRANNS